jgi:hypothetical protein
MRKIIVCLIVLLAATLASSGAPPDRLPSLVAPAQASGIMMMQGGVPPAPPAGDSCTDGLLFSWHMENIDLSLGSIPGCSVGDTTATLSGTAALTLTKVDGDYGLTWGTGAATFAVSNNDIIHGDHGTLDIWLYLTAHDNGDPFLVAYDGVNHENGYIQIASCGTGCIRSYYQDGTTMAFVTRESLSDSTWYHAKMFWDKTGAAKGASAGTSILTFCIDTDTGGTNCASTGYTSSNGTVGITKLILGEFNGWGSRGSFDVIKIYSGSNQ